MSAEDSRESDTIRDAVVEVEACMADAPTRGDTDSIKAWLFARQNSVAVRVERLLGLTEAREILTEAAGRTWKQVTDPKGQAQQLWQRLGRDLTPLAQGASEALERKVDFNPDGLLASVFSPKYTCREVALEFGGRHTQLPRLDGLLEAS